MPHGYWNKVLRVDLSSSVIGVDEITEEVWKLCIGGAGFGAKVLLEEIDADTDPFDPENPLVFALGPYQAGNNPGNAKWTVATKSPLTGTYGDSAASANWGPALKRAGYDALIVTGKADQPVFLAIDEDHVEIRDAGGLWGLDSYDTVDAVKEETGRDFSVVTIGPAGERLVRFACIVADAHSFAGRCGMGAVMGSKKLKAIAVRGAKSAAVHDREGLSQLARQRFGEVLAASKDGLRLHGTPDLCVTAEGFGDMPIKYWTEDTWPEGAKKLGAPNYTEVLHARPLPCANCPVGCHRNVELKSGPYAVKGPGPEYETLGMLGTNLMIDDLEAIAKANDICNRLGLDTISAGACLGLAMECYEKGWLTKAGNGLNLTWGNADAMIKLLNQMGNREGFGTIFADGALAAAKQIHPAAESLVVHVKGLDFPAHDARACWSLAVNYATCTRGACHMRGVTEDVEMGGLFIPELGIAKGWTQFFSPAHKSELAVKLQDFCVWMNSLVICAFMVDGGGLSFSALLELFNLATGWNWSVGDAMKSGERIFNLQRLVNLRDGHGRHTDTIPLKMTIPAKEGFRAGKTPTPFAPYLNEYYELRGWDTNGRPTAECLNKLGLLSYGRHAGILE